MDRKSWIEGLCRAYYHCKFFPFRRERRTRGTGGRKGFVGVQIDGLSAPHLRQALDRGYLPHIDRFLHRGHKIIEYQASLPSTTPAAQATIFYGMDSGIPAFRWFERKRGQVITCNDPEHVQLFREELFAGRKGLLDGGSSYSNILDGGAARSIFTVSSPHPQTLFGRLGGLRLILILTLHPVRVFRMAGASVLEFFVNRRDERIGRRKRRWRTSEGLFPFIRIFCNVILRELQTFGTIADIYAGVPNIYTTYSGYDELAHHFGPDSWPALRNLRYTDRRIGEIMRAVKYAAGADYRLVLLSDHGQTPGYPFSSRFGATLGEAVSAFLRENQQAAVSSGPLDFTRIQLGYLQEELTPAKAGWRRRLYRRSKDYLQKKIRDLVPETLKIDREGGVVITYSSSLAHLYLAGSSRPLTWKEVEEAQPLLLRFLCRHRGIGFVVARGEGEEICVFHRGGMLSIPAGDVPRTGLDFLRPYGDPHDLVEELRRYAALERCGDLILFGAYDREGIACFDDQVGGHGSVGGEQSRPFLILPLDHPVLQRERLKGYEFLHRDVFLPCLEKSSLNHRQSLQ